MARLLTLTPSRGAIMGDYQVFRFYVEGTVELVNGDSAPFVVRELRVEATSREAAVCDVRGVLFEYLSDNENKLFDVPFESIASFKSQEIK